MNVLLVTILLSNPWQLDPQIEHQPNPWQVGPAPSAEAVSPNWNLGADLGTLRTDYDGKVAWLHGARVAAAFAPHPRVWSSLELGISEGWRTCIDCRTVAGTWTLRGLVVDHPNVHVGVWSVLTTFERTVEWTPGVAIEAGTEHFRFDTSWMVWTTFDWLTTLRSTPELGTSFIWGAHQSTRVALVGLEPAVALQHRVRLRNWALAGTVRYGEEGVAFELGIRGYASVPWGARIEENQRRRREARTQRRAERGDRGRAEAQGE